MRRATASTRLAFASAALFYTALTLVLTFPLVLHLSSSVPSDLGDPLLSASLLWWNAHVVPLTQQWWDGFAFAPAHGMLAFSDHRLGLSLIAAPLQWLGAGPITAYNVVFLATFPLCAIAGHTLGFTLTRRHDAATLCGLASGFNPFRVAHFSHLELLAAFAMPAALAALHLYLRERRLKWIVLFAVALVVQGLCATYYLLFFFVLLGLWTLWFVRPRDWRVAAGIGVACAATCIVLLPIALPYSRIHREYGFSRLASEVIHYSADLTSFVTASPTLRIWGFTGVLEGNAERQIFPGLTIVILAVAGALLAVRGRTDDGRWKRAPLVLLAISGIFSAVALSFELFGGWRIRILGIPILVTDAYKPTSVAVLALIAAVALTPAVRVAWHRRSLLAFYLFAALFLFVCAMGPAPAFLGDQILYKPPYEWLMALPAFGRGVRAPARFAMPAILALAAAAALAFNRLPPGTYRRKALFVLCSLGIVADGWIGTLNLPSPPPLWPVPTAYQFGPVLELPLATGLQDFVAMYRATQHGHPVVNGNSGFIPPHYYALQLALDEGNTAVFDAFTQPRPLLVVIDKREDASGRWRKSVREFPRAQVVRDDERWAMFGIPSRPTTECHGPSIPIASATAADGPINVSLLNDGNPATAWASKGPQQLDDALLLDLGGPARFCGVRISLGTSWQDYARDLDITTSPDGVEWTRKFKGSTAGLMVRGAIEDPKNIWLSAPVQADNARFIKLRLDAPHLTAPWFIADLRVIGTRRDEAP